MKETYEELLARQAGERTAWEEQKRLEWEEQKRLDNRVTIQVSNYGKEGVPYSIEIKFPEGLNGPESNRVCQDLHDKAGPWLTALGYQFIWLPPKSEQERQEEIERLNRLENDLPHSVMAELAAIIEVADNVNDMGRWPAAARRGYEKMRAVVKAARGELHD